MDGTISPTKRRGIYGCCLGLSFFWACSMLTFRSSILLVGVAESPEINTFVVIVSFIANTTILFGFSAFIEKAPQRLSKAPLTLFCALIIVGIVTIWLSSCYLKETALYGALFVGAALVGSGYGYFWGSWAEALGRIHPSITSVSVPLAFLGTTILFVVISLVVSLLKIPAVLLMIPLPVISLCCLRALRSQDGLKIASETTSRQYLGALTSLVPLILATLVLSFLFGFMWETAVLSSATATEAHKIPLLVNLVAALVLVVLVICARKRVDVSLVYQILIPIVVVVFVILPFFWESYPIVLNAVVSTVYGIFDVLIWYLVAQAAYDFAVSGFVVGGIVRGISILSRLVGIGIGYLIFHEPEVADGAVLGLCAGALYVLVLLFLFLRRNAPHNMNSFAIEKEEASPALERESSVGSSDVVDMHEYALEPASGLQGEQDEQGGQDEDMLACFVSDYGLTRREAEVLPYLARGRSAKVIAEALFVSEPTIRTHTRRIFEKTCTHSKQELIDLVDHYELRN